MIFFKESNKHFFENQSKIYPTFWFKKQACLVHDTVDLSRFEDFVSLLSLLNF